MCDRLRLTSRHLGITTHVHFVAARLKTPGRPSGIVSLRLPDEIVMHFISLPLSTMNGPGWVFVGRAAFKRTAYCQELALTLRSRVSRLWTQTKKTLAR